jgi:tetratricopeptide (TPR) repeat protein
MYKAKKALVDKNSKALMSYGVQAYQAGNLVDANVAFQQVLKLDENNPDANHLLGLVARKNGNNESAIEFFSKAIKINSYNPAYHSNLGNSLRDLGHSNDAVASYQKAISILPNFATAHNNLGAALRLLGQLEDSKNSLETAIRLEPGMASAHVNLGNIMKDMGRIEEAKASYQSGLHLEPENSDALINLGSLLEEQNHLNEAIKYFREAEAIDPNCEVVHGNMGNALYKLGSLKEAEISYRLALKLNPQFKDPEFGLSLTLLSLGHLEEGWTRYEHRYTHANMGLKQNEIPKTINRATTDFSQPQWDGSSLKEKSIILWGDQGLGDEVRYASIIHDLQKTGANITIDCEKRLTDIFARSFPDANVLAAPYDGTDIETGQFDYQCPLVGLARFFRNDYKSFAIEPGYLKADPALITFWKEKLANISAHPKVGLSWNYTTNLLGREGLCANIEELAPILKISGIDFVNLQSEESDKDITEARERFGVEIHSWNDLDNRNDLNGVAALTSCLDLVISFPNFSAEIAGALGVPTLCFVDHKNSFDELGSKDNIWFPNTHHISKNRKDPWQSVFAEITEIIQLKFGLLDNL